MRQRRRDIRETHLSDPSPQSGRRRSGSPPSRTRSTPCSSSRTGDPILSRASTLFYSRFCSPFLLVPASAACSPVTSSQLLLSGILLHRLSREPWSAAIRLVGWSASGFLLALSFAVIYFWAPDWRQRHWRWFSPGTVIGITGWLIISLGFRIYLHFFNSYTLTYGSLGAVIILLMWFYISGLMLLLGAEIDVEARGGGCGVTARSYGRRWAALKTCMYRGPMRPYSLFRRPSGDRVPLRR